MPGAGGAPDPSPRDAVACDLVAEAVVQFGGLRVKALGRSMLPTIWPGDILRVDHVSAAELRVSDVILYRRGPRLFAHRLIRVGVGRDGVHAFLTRGDGHGDFDPPVPARDLIGRVTLVERGAYRLDPRRRAGLLWRVARAGVDAGLRGRRLAARGLRAWTPRAAGRP